MNDPTPHAGAQSAAPEKRDRDGREPEFSSLLDRYRRHLEAELERFLRERADAAALVDESTRELGEPLREFVARGGKRLRPALVHFACEAAGGASERQSLAVEMAVELLHTYLLVHDDIMDRAATRRGGPAAHRLFALEHRRRGWSGDAERHGEAVAILLGDLAHSEAVGLFLRGIEGSPRYSAISACFTEMCREVVLGQYLEVTAPQRRGLGEEDLLTILRLKSGRYSVERPIELGALLAGASAVMLAGLGGYGRAVGEAFQLQDDLLGVFGEVQEVGKPVGGDLEEGKFTLLILAALEAAGAADRETILQCLKAEEPDADQLAQVRRLVEEVGARQRVETMVDERLRTAREELEKLELEGEAEVFFVGLIEYLRERKT